jgi:septal ring factor EnvC (AmiA/AmiB activator)
VIDAQNDMNVRTARIVEITAEQTRIRENMKTVSPTADYCQRLLGKLNAQESSIEAMQRERDQLAAARDAARARLESYLSTLTVG